MPEVIWEVDYDTFNISEWHLAILKVTGGWKVFVIHEVEFSPEIQIPPGGKILDKTPVQACLCLLSIHIFCVVFHNHSTLRNENLRNRKPCISTEIETEFFKILLEFEMLAFNFLLLCSLS